MHKGRPGLRFGQKLNSGAPRALDPSRLVGTIEDFGLDEADRSPTSTKPNKTQQNPRPLAPGLLGGFTQGVKGKFKSNWSRKGDFSDPAPGLVRGGVTEIP